MENKHPIHVTVEYTGKKPFREEVAGNPTFGEVKLQAMKHFELDPSSAGKYVLQYEGTDLDDNRHLEALGKEKVDLQLTLNHEPAKG